MIVQFAKTTKIQIPEGTIWDYPMLSKDLGISFQQLKGRGPRQGRYLNKVCHEIYVIFSGTGTFLIGDEKFNAVARDIIIVEPNTPHFIETENLEYFTITRPDWYEEQAEISV